MSTLSYEGVLHLSQGAYNNYRGSYDYVPAAFTIEGLKAQFSFGFDRTGNQYYLHWSGGGDSVYISSGSITASQVGYSTSNWAHLFHAGEFPPQEEGRISGIGTTAPNRSYDLSFNVSVELHEAQISSDLLRLQLVQERENFARTVAAMSRNPSASDVRLVFPRTGQQLWANEALLIQSSPHYKTALSSAFAEGSASTETSLQAADVAPYTFEESDEETDKAEAEKAIRKKEVQTSTPFKTITVIDSSYSTYLAVLVWLQSHHISFAPLRSSFRTSGKSRLEATQAHTVAVAERGAKHPLVPQPSSPKSIYRLAHLLELQELCALALDNLVSQLTPENAAYELYSDVSTYYPNVRDAVLDYVVDNWETVKSAKATKEMKQQALRGELDGAAGTAMLLAEQLAE